MARKKTTAPLDLPNFVVVKDSEGNTGTIPDPNNQVKLPRDVTVHLDRGDNITVPSKLLERRKLGNGYIFKGNFAEFSGPEAKVAGEPDRAPNRHEALGTGAAAEQPPGPPASERDALVVPVVEEQLQVGRKRVETGKVRIRKVVHEHREVIEEPVFGEDVEVKRVPVGRAVDGPPPVRMEGDVMVIPLLEERVVTQKQLFLKEELHVTKRQYETTSSEEVTLRSEEAVVEEASPRDEQLVDKRARRRGAGR